MRKSHVIVNSVAVLLFAVTTLWSSQVLALELSFLNPDKDSVVCYLGEEEGDFFTFNVKEHSPLDLKLKKERWSSRHSSQTTYTLLGKNAVIQDGPITDELTIPLDEFGSIYGMVMVAKKKGARMAFTRAELLTSNYVQHVECESDEASATPERWGCRIEQELQGSGTSFFPYSLTRVNLYHAEDNILQGCQAFPATIMR